MSINRDDMLELTRRMTISRTHFTRIAGAYMDEEGYVDGTFNTHFLKLPAPEKTATLNISRMVLQADTNQELQAREIPGLKPGSIWQLLFALRDCDLKNDALMLTLYEMMGEKLKSDEPYAIYMYHGVYDVPIKAADKERLGESEEVYSYLIAAVCPLTGENEAGEPVCGFLYPAFVDRSTDLMQVNVFQKKNAAVSGIYDVLSLSE